ncbi:MAG: protocatechuate 3,4-dioxygenase subunit alpha [Comamonadaceae bacterium]|nr:MAG: protocatechuate 3,4-dioxygenase subunit alpha [Comamonadaceae bacterium]
MSTLRQTPSQTVGPYFAYGLAPTQYGFDLKSLFTPVLAQPHAAGQHMRLTGKVFDGAGNSIVDALIEIAHVDAGGKPVTSVAAADADGFTGFGRCGTGTLSGHRYEFQTIKPGSASPGEAPFINLIVTMRGLLVHTFGRIYFDDEPDANAADAVLQSVPAERRDTLIARRDPTQPGLVYRFDICMQDSAAGAETVFFDL